MITQRKHVYPHFNSKFSVQCLFLKYHFAESEGMEFPVIFFDCGEITGLSIFLSLILKISVAL